MHIRKIYACQKYMPVRNICMYIQKYIHVRNILYAFQKYVTTKYGLQIFLVCVV